MTTSVAARFTGAIDPGLQTAIDGIFTDVKGMVTGTLAPALFGLVLIGLGILVAVKYVRKGAKQV